MKKNTAKKKNMSKDNWEDSAKEVQNSWMKFNVPMEDKVKGTLIAKRTMKSTLPGAEGKLVNIYELKADMGVYHTLDDKKKVVDEPVTLNEGDFVSVGGTAVIDRQMSNIKVGQKVALKFLEEKPSKTKGFAPAKIVKVYTFENEDGTAQMDEAFLQENRTVDNF